MPVDGRIQRGRLKIPDNAMELTRVEKHISNCGGFLVDFERMSR